MNNTILSWQAHEYEHRPKNRQWYWMVGVVAGGIAIASIIMQNYLFALISVLAGFTVMLVASAQPSQHTYSFTEEGFMIGKDLIPYAKITRFAISETDPHLTLETMTLIGIIKAPLQNVDFRAVRTELKNRNIQEEVKLDQMVDRVVRTIGL